VPERVKAESRRLLFRTGALGASRRRPQARLGREISELVGDPARLALGVQNRERARMQRLFASINGWQRLQMTLQRLSQRGSVSVLCVYWVTSRKRPFGRSMLFQHRRAMNTASPGL
jgi:hypothetical protein